jgi:hypothetical protein
MADEPSSEFVECRALALLATSPVEYEFAKRTARARTIMLAIVPTVSAVNLPAAYLSPTIEPSADFGKNSRPQFV